MKTIPVVGISVITFAVASACAVAGPAARIAMHDVELYSFDDGSVSVRDDAGGQADHPADEEAGSFRRLAAAVLPPDGRRNEQGHADFGLIGFFGDFRQLSSPGDGAVKR